MSKALSRHKTPISNTGRIVKTNIGTSPQGLEKLGINSVTVVLEYF